MTFAQRMMEAQERLHPEMIGSLRSEIERLRTELFKIQCEQLDRATDTARTAKSHREKCMVTRDRIITVLSR